MAALQQVLGHASIVTTQRYARLTDEAVRREAARLQGATTVNRWRLMGEAVLAAACGLLGVGFDRVENWASTVERGFHPLTRASSVLRAVLSPGNIVGQLVGGCLDIAGFTTDWRFLDRIEGAVGMAANCAIFAAVWIVLRTKPEASQLRRLTVAICLVWILAVTLLAALGNLMFAVY